MSRFFHLARAAAFAGVLSGCVVWSAAALAADDSLPQGALAVHAADFDTPAAVAHLKRKLDRVAKDICLGQSGDLGSISRSEQACYDTAMKDGLAQIDSREQQAMRDHTVRFADDGKAHGSAQ